MKKTILIVDDDVAIRESLRKILQAEGYEVVLAADSQEALDRFDPERVDLLLLDLNLPTKSGWDVFERFTFINPLLPIVIITGRDNQCELAVAAGVGALMEKPLDVPFLLRTMTALLAEPAEARLRRVAGFSHTRYAAPQRIPLATYKEAGSKTTAESPQNLQKQRPL
jgi:DNA-binding response OmpR family regulator